MHEGHRQRLLGKLKRNENLYEFEVLEILLFNAYPRRDVRPIAQELLTRFPGIGEVFAASLDELCAIEGVGENVALYLKCMGKCLNADYLQGSSFFTVINCTADLQRYAALRFRAKVYEFLELYFVDKGGRVRRIQTYTSNDVDCVRAEMAEIAEIIQTVKPYGLYMAHNHVSTSSKPSKADDAFTCSLMSVCQVNKVRFLDHCIYSTLGDPFSYFVSGRMEIVKQKCQEIEDKRRSKI